MQTNRGSHFTPTTADLSAAAGKIPAAPTYGNVASGETKLVVIHLCLCVTTFIVWLLAVQLRGAWGIPLFGLGALVTIISAFFALPAAVVGAFNSYRAGLYGRTVLCLIGAVPALFAVLVVAANFLLR